MVNEQAATLPYELLELVFAFLSASYVQPDPYAYAHHEPGGQIRGVQAPAFAGLDKLDANKKPVFPPRNDLASAARVNKHCEFATKRPFHAQS